MTAGRGLYVRDEGERYVVLADLPGLAPEDLELEVSGRQLTVSGAREITVPEGFQLTHRERSSWRFERTLTLPDDVDVEHIDATRRDGVLEVHLPRVAQVQPRKIEITA